MLTAVMTDGAAAVSDHRRRGRTDAGRVCASLMTLLPEFDFSFETQKNVLLGMARRHSTSFLLLAAGRRRDRLITCTCVDKCARTFDEYRYGAGALRKREGVSKVSSLLLVGYRRKTGPFTVES